MDLSNENVIHMQKNGIEYLQFRKLLPYQDKLKHAYSIGIDRNYRTAKVNKEKIEPEKYQKAIKDYESLCQAIGSNYKHIVKPNQEHTQEVKIVTRKINNQEPDFNLEQYNNTDGLITKEKEIMLATTNADCILLLFYDPVKNVIANTHSGWKGTLKQIARKTIEKMQEEKHCNPKDILVFSCPSILQCHFEVDKDVADAFIETLPFIKGKEEYIKAMGEKQGKPKWNIDTVAINRVVLENAGIPKENIILKEMAT